MEHLFKVGDKVIIKNCGEEYCRYVSWFRKYAPELLDNYDGYGVYPRLLNEQVCVVMKIGSHIEFPNKRIFAVKNPEGNIALISEQGLEPFVKDIYYAKDIIGKVAINTNSEWSDTEYKILYASDKDIVLDSGTRSYILTKNEGFPFYKYAFQKKWKVVDEENWRKKYENSLK